MSHEEPHVVSALVELCRRLGVRCVVQVGAFDGYEANEIRKALDCRAVAIEANSRCRTIADRLEYHHAVIGATDGVTTFYLHPTHALSGQLARGESGEVAVECEQMRLDTFCRERDIRPDALIIDTEGTGLDVLEGCGDLLDGVKLIYAELQNAVLRPGIRLRGEVEAFLLARGFEPLPGPPAYDGGSQGNYTFIRKEEPAWVDGFS